jgi:hypothetical protein
MTALHTREIATGAIEFQDEIAATMWACFEEEHDHASFCLRCA